MKLARLARRILTPGILVALRGYLDHRCMISPKAEVELSRNLKIGSRAVIGSFTKIKSSDGPLQIGARVDIANSCTITSHKGGVYIGDDCLIGPGVCIIGSNYRYDRLDMPIRLQDVISPKGIRIGDNVWIGANCTILDGAEIGSGAIVTPNSVVSSKLPANVIVQGSPAKPIFTRR